VTSNQSASITTTAATWRCPNPTRCQVDGRISNEWKNNNAIKFQFTRQSSFRGRGSIKSAIGSLKEIRRADLVCGRKMELARDIEKYPCSK